MNHSNKNIKNIIHDYVSALTKINKLHVHPHYNENIRKSFQSIKFKCVSESFRLTFIDMRMQM